MFAHWIKDRIEQYGFIEHHDYVVFAETGNNPSGGRPAKEYAISLDMAKELAMVERNGRCGSQAGKDFAEVLANSGENSVSGRLPCELSHQI